MSIRNILSTHNLLGVSARFREDAINTPRTPEVSMLVAKEDIINLIPRRESNAAEAIGKEEADNIYDLGALSEGTFNFNKAQPQHFGFLCSYGLGVDTPTAAGTGYKHTITPIAADLDAARSNPSFTATFRYGNQVMKRRFASMFVDSFVASFNKDDWAKIVGTIKGTGYIEDNITEETVAQAGNLTEVTLAANGVQGATAAARLANVQRILVGGVDVSFTVISDATPAVITCASPGLGAGEQDWKILYIPTEAAAWHTFPARVTETPLRVVQLVVKAEGTWDGTDYSPAGHPLAAELTSLEWSFNNGITPEFTPGSGLTTYGDRALRTGRTQKLKVNREFRDFVYQNHITDNDTFSVHIIAEGAIFDAPHKYTVQIVFPKVSVLGSPVGVDNNRLSEAVDLQILEDDTYGSVEVIVKNLQPSYAAAGT